MHQQNIIDCYNRTAGEYAINLYHELDHKPLDRLLLQQFAADNAFNGEMLDVGYGPGQTTRFLADHGVVNILGTDLSEGMVKKAGELNPDLRFQSADMLQLKFADETFASAVAFYAIVHFNLEQLAVAFAEINRVLVRGGQFLFSFHIGDEVVHRDEFFGQQVNIDFIFFSTIKVLDILKTTGFKIVEAIERYPYEGVEHPTKRAYIKVEKL